MNGGVRVTVSGTAWMWMPCSPGAAPEMAIVTRAPPVATGSNWAVPLTVPPSAVGRMFARARASVEPESCGGLPVSAALEPSLFGVPPPSTPDVSVGGTSSSLQP